MTDRSELGEEKFGVPALSVIAAVHSVLEREPWNKINREAVDYYIEKMPMQWLPQLADARMTDEQLAGLDPNHVKDSVFLLTRDMFRHNELYLLPAEAADWDDDWVEALFREIAEEAQLDLGRYADWEDSFDIEDPFDHDKIGWAIRMASFFSAEPEKLALTHEAIVEGVVEDVLAPMDEDEDWGEDDMDWDDEEE